MAAETKQQLKDIFTDLTEKNGETVTISTLTKHCCISRQTFYYYFRDVQDVAESVIRDHIADMAKQCLLLETPRDIIHFLLETLYADNVLKRYLDQEPMRKNFFAFLNRKMSDIVYRILMLQDPDSLRLPPEKLEQFLDWWSHGMTSYVLYILCAPERPDPDVLTERLDHLLRTAFLAMHLS